MRYFVELSIPDTDTSIGFYLYGDTPEDVTPENPFILSGDATSYKTVSTIKVNNVAKVTTVDQAD